MSPLEDEYQIEEKENAEVAISAAADTLADLKLSDNPVVQSQDQGQSQSLNEEINKSPEILPLIGEESAPVDPSSRSPTVNAANDVFLRF